MDFSEGDRFFRNEGGVFVAVPPQSGGLTRRGSDMGVAVADLTGTGRLNLNITGIRDPVLHDKPRRLQHG
jgi:hypothetical protein